jgi:ribosomal protein L11 methyltransferase
LELSDGPLTVEQQVVCEEDWAHAWKQFYHPLRVGRRLVIKPTWEPWPPADDPSAARDDDVVIELDPQMAFGTGSHPSTQLCLLALEDLVIPGARVLDVGCGSGILSLAAAQLGASQVIAVDVDPVAVQTACSNSAASSVAERIIVRLGSLDAVPEHDFDVIVANINVPVICQIAADCLARLKTPGYLIAAGIVDTYLPAPLQALQAAGFLIPDVRHQEGWACIIARKGCD